MPPILQPGTARPLFVPEVMIGVEFEQGCACGELRQPAWFDAAGA